MKIYKSYYIVKRKNTSKIFLISSLVFSTKKSTIVLLEIPSLSNKFFITNDTCIVIIIIYCFFLLSKFFCFHCYEFFFVSLPPKNLSKFLPTIFCTHVYQGVCKIRLEQFLIFCGFNFACSFFI